MLEKKNFTVPQQWVKADRATYNLVGATLRLYADNNPDNDPDLTGINGPAVLQLLDSWLARLEAAELQMRWLEEGSMFQ
jgi:hypothetical protein